MTTSCDTRHQLRRCFLQCFLCQWIVSFLLKCTKLSHCFTQCKPHCHLPVSAGSYSGIVWKVIYSWNSGSGHRCKMYITETLMNSWLQFNAALIRASSSGQPQEPGGLDWFSPVGSPISEPCSHPRQNNRLPPARRYPSLTLLVHET